jgi:tetratricopeptide (TPR) repeat protein
MGRAAFVRGDDERAATLMLESQTRFRTLDEAEGCALSCWHLGHVAAARGEYAEAAARYEESLAIARQAENAWVMASALLSAADVARARGESERAIAMLKESLGHYRAFRAPWGICLVLSTMAAVLVERGQSERAACLFGAEQALRNTIGYVVGARWRPVQERDLASARATLGGETFQAAWAEGETMTREQAVEYALSTPA